jgi:hypothetical protein
MPGVRRIEYPSGQEARPCTRVLSSRRPARPLAIVRSIRAHDRHIKFPVQKPARARHRVGLKRPGKEDQTLADIDTELRQINNAIRALSRRWVSLLARYRHQMKRVEAEALAASAQRLSTRRSRVPKWLETQKDNLSGMDQEDWPPRVASSS